MHMRYRLGPDEPTIADDCFIAPTASIIGRVSVMQGASVWFGAVLRGDSEPIAIGPGSNVQDNAVLHTDPGFPLVIEENVTIGHLAMVHGCTVGAGSLIGMGATVMNGAKIGKNCLIGACSLITEGKEIPDNSVVRGSPGKVVGEVSEAHLAMLAATAKSYQDRAQRYRSTFEPI
jgi:carbonic anhydrase/acetyltransferase-like protein (isoleucine patch superfamily)